MSPRMKYRLARIVIMSGMYTPFSNQGRIDTFEKLAERIFTRNGPVPPFDPGKLAAKGSLFLTRPTLAHYTLDRAELLQRAGDLFGWTASGKLKLRIDKVSLLSQAAEAQRLLESRKTTGKIVLVP